MSKIQEYPFKKTITGYLDFLMDKFDIFDIRPYLRVVSRGPGTHKQKFH